MTARLSVTGALLLCHQHQQAAARRYQWSPRHRAHGKAAAPPLHGHATACHLKRVLMCAPLLPVPCRMARAPASASAGAALADALEVAALLADFVAVQLALEPRVQDARRIMQVLQPRGGQQGGGDADADDTLLALLREVSSGRVAQGWAGALEEVAGLASKAVAACERARQLYDGMAGCA
jgi:hypothetical protein